MHFVQAKSLLTKWNGMNIYRGCSHGCIYCDSRSDCYQMNHPFEDIEVKENASELLEKILRSKRSRIVIGTGSMSDPYQHCEKDLGLMRKCLELIDRYEFGASVITKSDLTDGRPVPGAEVSFIGAEETSTSTTLSQAAFAARIAPFSFSLSAR